MLDHEPGRLGALPAEIGADILRLIPAQAAISLQVLPLALVGCTLRVAIPDSADLGLFQKLRLLTGRPIQAVEIDPVLLLEGLDRWYREGVTSVDQDRGASPIPPADTRSGGVKRSRSAVQLIDEIIAEAVQRQASDIHIEPFDQQLQLRYRIDGFLQTGSPLDWRMRSAVVSRIKVMADLDIAEKRRPQDGKIRVTVHGRAIDIRVSTAPTVFGEKVVLRILDRSAVALDLEQLGFEQAVLTRFKQAVERPYGMILVTGPTGSGKTTTLYAALNHIKGEGINILTVEDPIEYNLEGVNQTQVHPEIGLTFAQVLRAFLRQDPNVILVGEIRDRETAEIAIRAALTGHLVVSSVHTNDAAGTIGRLLDMGLEPFLVASSLNLVVAQRLVRRNCQACKQVITLSSEEIKRLDLVAPRDGNRSRAWQGQGCSRCYGTGYRGRIALAEVMPVSAAVADLISGKAPAQEIRRQAIEEGMRTLHEDGLVKMAQGITSPAEIIRETLGAVR